MTRHINRFYHQTQCDNFVVKSAMRAYSGYILPIIFASVIDLSVFVFCVTTFCDAIMHHQLAKKRSSSLLVNTHGVTILSLR